MLMEIGALATESGMQSEAKMIFTGARWLRPKSEYPYLGIAVALMNDQKYKEAIYVLREGALAINPDSDLAKSYLGLALKLSGLTYESKDLLKEVLDKSKDENALSVAEALVSS